MFSFSCHTNISLHQHHSSQDCLYHLVKLNGLPIEVSMFRLAIYQYILCCFCFLVFFLGDLAKLYWYLMIHFKPLWKNTQIFFFLISTWNASHDCHFVCHSKFEHALFVRSFLSLCTLFICLYLVWCCFLKCAFYQIGFSLILLLICVENLCLSEKDLKCTNMSSCK